MSNISKHEHENGAPLTSDCDNWCKAKYDNWLKTPRFYQQEIQRLTQENEALQKRVNKLRAQLKIFAGLKCDCGIPCDCYSWKAMAIDSSKTLANDKTLEQSNENTM